MDALDALNCKVDYLMSLQHMALTPCNCEKCWKDKVYKESTKDWTYTLDWERRRMDEKIHKEWLVHLETRRKKYLK